MYAALENMNIEDKRPISKYSKYTGLAELPSQFSTRERDNSKLSFLFVLASRSGSKDPYTSKGPSLERNYGKYEGRGSRSGSQHRSNDSSASSSQRSTPAPVVPPMAPPKLQPVQPAPVQQMTEEQMERRINNCLDEYVTGSSSMSDYFLDISSVIPVSYFPRMIEDRYVKFLHFNLNFSMYCDILLHISLQFFYSFFENCDCAF